jgi:hypothetical protein
MSLTELRGGVHLRFWKCFKEIEDLLRPIPVLVNQAARTHLKSNQRCSAIVASSVAQQAVYV